MSKKGQTPSRPELYSSSIERVLDSLDLALESQKIESEVRQFLIDFLPLLDGVEKLCRGLEELPAEALVDKAESLTMLADLADKAVHDIGLERFGRPGEAIDGSRHEIVQVDASTDAPPRTILQVIECGWALRGNALRRAKIVASGLEKRRNPSTG